MNVSRKVRRGRRLGLMAALTVSIALLGVALAAAPAMAEFGINNFDVTFTNEDGTPATQAGSHPYEMTTSFGINYTGGIFEESAVPDEELKDMIVDQVSGFIGDPNTTPKCSTVDFLATSNLRPLCPDNTAIGVVAAELPVPGAFFSNPVYNLPAPPGVAAEIGFQMIGVPVAVDIGLDTKSPYDVKPTLHNIPQTLNVFASQLILWGNPNDPSHDSLRGNCLEANFSIFEPGYSSTGECPTENANKPFLTLPGSCTGPAINTFEADSWQNPGVFVRGGSLTHVGSEPPNPQGFTGCGKLPFSPEASAEPSTEQAGTGTGLDFNLDFNQQGLQSASGLAQSEAKKAEVTLPEGVTINPSLGEGLGVCTPADYAGETLHSAPAEGCPNSSKIGTLHLETPIVEEAVEGSVYLAQQDNPETTEAGAENPFDSLIALYLVLKNPNLGALVKLPMKVEPDRTTGQLVATMEDIPQIPFSHFNFHFKEGTRPALITPSSCGTYTTEAKFWPWSDPVSPRTVTSSFEITEGVHGGPCPSGGVPPFDPKFEAGSINNNAGSYSPFDMRLTREDGEQDMTKFSATLPPGVLGSLAGVAKCPDSAIAAARGKTGRQELASPSCPSNSEIGHTLAGAGVGSALTYVPGKIYLGGAYHGDPLSVIAITPAVAGPFDAGTVVVQEALTLNPKTAEVEVDGANSDPIPHILKGIVLKLRDLRVNVDRPEFTLNPTNCDESQARSVLFGSYMDPINPFDDKPVDLQTRYQAANCLNLGFKPHLGLHLKGGTRRGAYPGLKAVYSPKKGDANIKGLVVRLPRSAFLEQGHIRTICTRVQYAAQNCPAAARYGYVKAWTPLLEEPLQGPVWLRSSNHKLPDMVFDLRGLVDVEVSTRIDSFKGGIRATVEDAPDAPISRVILRMQGGKKGLIVNSRNLCAHKSRASALAMGQNGKRSSSHPVMQTKCAKSRKHKRHHRKAKRARVARSSAVS